MGTIKGVEIKNFDFSYLVGGSQKNIQETNKQIFSSFNLSVDQGEWVAVTGRSGCGKSTLICSLCGLAQKVEGVVFSGDILLFGKRVEEYSCGELATTIGVVFQTPQNRIVSPTVEEEIWFGLQNLCLPREEITKRTDEVLKELGMEKFKKQNPSSLSGGQQQLVSFGAVVAMRPRIYLLDEVMSQLDTSNLNIVLTMIKRLKDDGATIIMVEHSPEISKNAQRNVAIGGNT